MILKSIDSVNLPEFVDSLFYPLGPHSGFVDLLHFPLKFSCLQFHFSLVGLFDVLYEIFVINRLE